MAAPANPPLAMWRDFALSMLSLVCGGLYPTLHPGSKDLTGKVAIVTGANSGIGRQIAMELLRQNAVVYLACRSTARAEEAISQITADIPDSADRAKTLLLDTSSLSSVNECAQAWKKEDRRIDILVHNAGISSTPADQPFTSDGMPTMYATTIVGSFLLTHHLEPYLSNEARIIFTSSPGQYAGDFTPEFSLSAVKNRLEPGFHTPSYALNSSGHSAHSPIYSNTKMMQVIFAKLLQKRWDAGAKVSGRLNNRVAHAFSPGFTMTPIFGKMTAQAFWNDPLYCVLKASTVLATDVSQGAATAVWLATTDDEAVVGQGAGGSFWEWMTRRLTKVDFMSLETLERFWIRWEADAGITWR